MSARFDFFFRQLVTESEMDAAFAALELAEQRIQSDNGIIGVVSGGSVNEHSPANLTVDVVQGVCYDSSGQRIAWTGTQVVDMAVDYGGTPTTVATPGNSKILSIFANFTRDLTDPRTDGNGDTVFYNRAEDFEFVVRQSAEAVSPVVPPLESGKVLLADITIVQGQTAILTANIGTARRQWAFKLTGTVVTVGTAEEALQALATGLDTNTTGLAAHLADTVDAHDASAISNVAAGGIVATTVQAAIDELDTEKMPKTGGAFSAGITVPAANNYAYATARTVDIALNNADAYPNRVAVTNWVMASASGLAWTCSAGDATEHVLYFPMNGRIPRGSQITRYSLTVDQTDASGSLIELGYWGIGAAGAWTAIDSTGPILASAGEALFNSGALAHTFDDTSRHYYVRVRCNVGQVSSFTVYGVSIRCLVTNVAP